MNHRLFRTLVLATSLGFLVGCQTVERRIQEKPEVFYKLDRETQDKILQGIIDIGYNEDMVYLALGKADEQRERVTENGRTVTWIYNTYYTRYDGRDQVGYHRRVYYDPLLRSYRVHYRPVFADTYREEKEERIRITFQGGRVTEIEQAKD
ncbi:hypothetical protein ESB00_01915 [Oleiharenicola lentus]|uniref:Uncharacterized protein n=1 Tax=Oleiharenicola lentus TaxID=2508720 RepID=A0A4Q1C705_9BACT|nr:hypothetical protein [Oleiharenicola lentus]RXK54677.1 hypothetical protein ESB00_01915 [Oleiharenicola lentus]